MLSIEASRAARASAIWRRVSGEWGRVEGWVETLDTEVDGGWEEVLNWPFDCLMLGVGAMAGERDAAWVLVEAEAEADMMAAM